MEILLQFFGDLGLQSGAAQDLGVTQTTALKTISYEMNQIAVSSQTDSVSIYSSSD